MNSVYASNSANGLGKALASLGVVLCLCCVGPAATIVVGDHDLAAGDKAFVPILIEREDGDPDLLGVELAVQIGDGTVGPRIGLVDFVTGTIFENNNTGSRDKGSLPWQAFWETTTAAGAVSIPDSGLLAAIEIDTSGWTSGTFDLALTSVNGTSTVLFDETATLLFPNNGGEIIGSVTVVPEPRTAVVHWFGSFLVTSTLCLNLRDSLLRLVPSHA